jgi:hypothetical protein
MGRPFGPGGTLRHGLLIYWTSRMTTRVANRPRRGVKSCEGEAWKRELKGRMPAAGLFLSRVMEDLSTRNGCLLLFELQASRIILSSFPSSSVPKSAPVMDSFGSKLRFESEHEHNRNFNSVFRASFEWHSQRIKRFWNVV